LSFWQGKQPPDVRPALLRGRPIAFRRLRGGARYPAEHDNGVW
jgi:hypothetical protein